MSTSDKDLIVLEEEEEEEWDPYEEKKQDIKPIPSRKI